MLKNRKVLAGGAVAMIAVAAAVYFLLLGSSGTAEEDGAVEAEPTPVHVEGRLGPHVTLPDRVFTLLSSADQPRYLKLQIVLEFETEDAGWFELSGHDLELRLEEFAEEIPVPLIEDVVTTTVSAKSAEDLSSPAGKDALRAEIREAVRALLPEPHVRRVLFTNFITQ